MPDNALNPDLLTYDAATQTLRYHFESDGNSAVPKADSAALSRIGREGSYDGDPVQRVVVRCASEDTARYNADALGFLKIGTELPDGTLQKSAKFAVREDFGIDD